MKKLFRSLVVLTAAAALCFACEKPDNPNGGGGGDDNGKEEQIDYAEQQRRKAALDALSFLKNDIMSDYYYWYKLMPNKEYTYKTDIYKYFDSILYEKDRWSWMMDGQEYIAEESGLIFGTYGASYGQSDYENDYSIYVRYVFPNSPFSEIGVQRGWKIDQVDNKSVVGYWLTSEDRLNQLVDIISYPSTTEYHAFGFIDNDGNKVDKSVKAVESLNTRPCIAKKIFTAEDYPGLTAPVGYFCYLSFKADDDVNGKSMLDDITEPMAYFKENNVKTLIVDLRYNGGGDSRASDLLVSYLAPHSADGEVYVKRTHNDKLRSEDEETKVSCAADSPNFEKLYFITGKGSASASEMTLNGLKPLADLTHVGGITYGKPNGMYVFYYPGDNAAYAEYRRGNFKNLKYVFLPICFYNANGLGENIPDEGLTPDNIRPDDIYHDFDVTEDNIAACLYNIVNGGFPELPEPPTKAGKSSYDGPRVKLPLNREDYDKNYGSFVVKPDFL